MSQVTVPEEAENTRDPITTHSLLVTSRTLVECFGVVRQCLYYPEIISLYSESPSMQDLDAVFWDHRTQCISFVSLHANVHILGVKMLKYIVVVKRTKKEVSVLSRFEHCKE